MKNMHKITLFLIMAIPLMTITNATAQKTAVKKTTPAQATIKLPDNTELVTKAKSGDPDAQAYVGHCYYLGKDGVKQIRQQSYIWLSKSASKKSPYGLFWLAEWYYFYQNNEDLQEKYMKEAFPIFQQRATNGDIKAMFYLGKLYEGGIAVSENIEKAKEWYSKAAEKDDVDAILSLAEISSSPEFSYRCYKRLAELGNSEGFYKLALCYINGDQVEKSYTEAIRYLEMAIEKGNEYAMNQLGDLYEEGIGIQKNLQKAIEYYKMSADKCYGSADKLGCFYRDGVGVDRNYESAVKYFKKASGSSEYDDSDAALDLKVMLKKGAAYYSKLPLRSPDDLYEIKENDPFYTLRLSDNWDDIPKEVKMIYLKHFKREKIREWGAERATKVAQQLVEIGFTEEQIRYSQGFRYDKHFVNSPNGRILIMKYSHCIYFLLNDKLIAMSWKNGLQVGDMKVIHTYAGNYVVTQK